jgi:hypothetical protein
MRPSPRWPTSTDTSTTTTACCLLRLLRLLRLLCVLPSRRALPPAQPSPHPRNQQLQIRRFHAAVNGAAKQQDAGRDGNHAVAAAG